MAAKDHVFPILATKELVVFPNSSVPLSVSSGKNVAAIACALDQDSQIVVVPVKDGKHPKDAAASDLESVGTICKIEQARGNEDEGYQIIVSGLERCKVETLSEQDAIFFECQTEQIKADIDIEGLALEELMNSAKALAIDILKLSRGTGIRRLSDLVQGIEEPELFINLSAAHLELSLDEKIACLKETSVKKRLLSILGLLNEKLQTLQVQAEINKKLSQQMDKKQKEVILREQLSAIREELGDMEPSGEDGNYFSRIESSNMPEKVKALATDEAKRLESTPSVSPEYSGIRNYLDLLLSMPWKSDAPTKIDIDEARRILDAEHHGLDKVKDRIIQHLAVMQLQGADKGSVLLLLGPPGVGKTSLGKSIAKAMGRKFVKASLGGVRDEADIRGHRRTYVGAMPGRIIKGIKRAESMAPVFLLDEVDKLAKGWTGDPAGALLEVLDPEQNSQFEDHFLDMPYDLSKVVFIATANSMDGIPPALRDRMEIIQLSGYTSSEKLKIAKDHLWSRELKKHGLSEDLVSLSDNAFMRLITRYTRESGVRELGRKLGSICLHAGEKIVRQGQSKHCLQLNADDLQGILGKEPFFLDVAETILPPGVVTGLAWTPMGGDILFIECKAMKGKGKLTMTGQMGDVMKESLQIASSHIRSHLSALNPDFDYDKTDIHVHIPAGAIPKDGPSAGITMLSALASLVAQRPINPELAMSGELTLRGAVLPVGGIKEKLIAAHMAGIKSVILSRKNDKDLEDLPLEVREALDIVLVDTVEEVLSHVLDIDVNSESKPFAVGSASIESHPLHLRKKL